MFPIIRLFSIDLNSFFSSHLITCFIHSTARVFAFDLIARKRNIYLATYSRIDRCHATREREEKKNTKYRERAQQPKNVTNSSQITHLLFLKFIHTSAPSMIPPKWKTFINRFATLLVDGQRWNYHFFFSLPNVLGVIYLAALIRRKQLVLLITFDLFDWCARNSFVFVCTIYY